MTRLRHNPISTLMTPTNANPVSHQIGGNDNDESNSEEDNDLRGFHNDDELFVGDNVSKCLDVDDLLHRYLPDSS